MKRFLRQEKEEGRERVRVVEREEGRKEGSGGRENERKEGRKEKREGGREEEREG